MDDSQLSFDFHGPDDGKNTYIDWAKTRESGHPSSKPNAPIKLRPIGKRKAGGSVLPASWSSALAMILGVVLVYLCMFGYLGLYRGWQGGKTVPASAQESSAEAPEAQRQDKKPITLDVKAGMMASEIARFAEAKGVVESADGFLAYLKETGLASRLRTGSYQLSKDMGSEALARLLTQAPATKVVVQPGWTIKSVDQYLAHRSGADEGAFEKAVDDLVAENGLSFGEGWLLAGAYDTNDPKALAEAMYQGMLDAIGENLDSPVIARYGVDSVLVIASLIQSETQDAGQMPVISGIIQNRLKAGMPLGIDATTRYELDDWENPIPQSVYEKDTPYNTRRKPGLPPSGISCPSREALHAACWPKETDALYYLHDPQGGLHTSLTYEEHLRAIKRYLDT